MRLSFLLIALPIFAYSACSEYYLSLDFGGHVGDGMQITDYLAKNKTPHLIFMVGANLKTDAAKELCSRLKRDKEFAKYVKLGNHTLSHKGFTESDSRAYIEKEIMENERRIISMCGKEHFVKVFRYPKGQTHPIAEKILAENDYTPNYSKYTKGTEPSSYGVGWTSDTKDWLEEGAASVWAQKQYYKNHKEFMPVTKSSINELKRSVAASPVELEEIKKALDSGTTPQVFNSKEHKAIEGWHGPTTSQVVEKVLNDKGVSGKCVPLAHFGGYNTLSAFKKILPELKSRNVEFKHFDDGLRYAMEYFPSKVDPMEEIIASCGGDRSLPETNIHIVKEGETLFAISRKYGLSVEKIKEYNSLVDNEIEIEQKLFLFPHSTVHVVKKGETLFSISRAHNISVDDLKRVNSLESNELEIGQLLRY